MYYRVAVQVDSGPGWQWRSTLLNSLHSLFQFLRVYRAFPQDHLQVFSFLSREDMREQLRRKNAGEETSAVTAAAFLRQRRLCVPEWTGNASAGTEPERVFTAFALTSSSREGSSGTDLESVHSMSPSESRRREMEGGVGGDHDLPYRFTVPASTPQVLAWIALFLRVQEGTLQP